MGSSGLISEEEKSKVESASLSELFEEVCPIYMSYGMSYNDFWYGSPWIVKYYREANKLRLQQQDENNWMMGMYVYEAILDASPVLHAFSKKGTKPLPYSDKPKLYNVFNKNNEKDTEQYRENERLKFLVQMNNWFRATKNHFENKK